MAETVHTNQNISSIVKTWSLVIGICLTVLGIFTIVFSTFTSFVTVLFLGVVLLIRGFFDIFHSIRTYRMPHFWNRFLMDIFSLLVGVFLVTHPAVSIAVITLFISAFFIITGLYRTVSAPVEKTRNWEWVLFSGIFSIIVGLLVWTQWPFSALWFIGLLIGIEILSLGISILILPYAVQKAREELKTGYGKPIMGR